MNDLDKHNVAYGNDVITKIESERDQVRERPNLFFGTDDVYGALNAPMELIVNGADELGAGYGDTISIVVDNDYNIEIEDNGRGVPMDWSAEAGKFNWDLVYNQMYASGKRKNGAYDAAAGLNGVGAAITNFTSLYMKVVSRRVEERVDSKGKKSLVKVEYEMNFENGYPKGQLIKRAWADSAKSSGTYVKFKTDPSVFQDVEFTVEMLCEKVRRLATVKGGHHYKVKFMDRPEIDFYFEDGPKSFVEEVVANRLTADAIMFGGNKQAAEIIKGKTEIFDVKMNATLTFSLETELKESYHNGLYLIEHGTSVDGFKAGVAQVIDTYAKKNGKLGAKERIGVSDIDDIICFVVSTEFNGDFSSWDGQDKKAIKNSFLVGICKQITTDKITEWASTHQSEMDKVVNAVLELRKAKDRAAAVKSTVIKKLSNGVSNFKTRPNKLVDCENKNVLENEIYFVEGESAKGTTVLARNQKMQAVYPLTGKILNVDKASLETIFKNKVILDLVQCIGCGVEVKSKYLKDLPKFDITKLNYGKLIISTDADDDGFHIQCLLLVMLYKLMPTLIKTGHVYIAEAPLFMTTYNIGGSKHRAYTYSIEERNKVLADLKQRQATKIETIRFKGLGEMDSDQMAATTMNPMTRRLTRVEWPADVEKFEKTMHELMGDDLESRREWIADYFEYTKSEDGDDDEDAFVAAVIE